MSADPYAPIGPVPLLIPFAAAILGGSGGAIGKFVGSQNTASRQV